MSKPKKCPPPPPCEKWAVPLADFFSLLLALFIALYAIASVNTDKSKMLKEEFVKIFDFPSTQVVKKESKNTEKAKPSGKDNEKGNSSTQSVNQQESIEKLRALLDQKENQFYMELPSVTYFAKGATTITNNDDLLYLKRIKMIMAGLGEGVKLEIRGYSDSDDSYLKSFDLAAARARNVLEILIKSGVAPDKLSFKSMGANEPKFNNSTNEGVKNNRVELYFKTDINDLKSRQTVLDTIKALK